MTGERIAETYSWTVSGGAGKVNSVSGVKGAEVGRKSAVSGVTGVKVVVHIPALVKQKKRVFDYGQFYAVMLD